MDEITRTLNTIRWLVIISLGISATCLALTVAGLVLSASCLSAMPEKSATSDEMTANELIGMLLGGDFPTLFASSKVKAAKAQLSAFETLLSIYQLDIGSYPTTEQGLQALHAAPADLADPIKWTGPYYNDIPPDPWQNEYVYEWLGPNQYRVYSAGPDGQIGTDDDIGYVEQ